MPRKKIRLISSSCKSPFVRVCLLAGIFGLAALGFQWNFDRHMRLLNAGYMQDSGNVLSRGERARLGLLRGTVRDMLGMDLMLRIEGGAGAVQVPNFPASTLFVGVNPQTRRAVIVVPPLAKKVMGEGQRLLAEEALAVCMQINAPGLCLERTVQSLLDKLTAGE